MPTDTGAEFRDAMAAVGAHRKVQADAELSLIAFLRSSPIPLDVLYDRETGEPLDPILAGLHSDVDRAVSDVEWCQALVIACGEAVKGCTFADAGGLR